MKNALYLIIFNFIVSYFYLLYYMLILSYTVYMYIYIYICVCVRVRVCIIDCTLLLWRQLQSLRM